jgi:ATP-dependent Clp protease ATP-binding subunit ClpA
MNEERLRSFVERMRERVVGQPLAIAKIKDTLTAAAASPKTGRPLATFLFVGGAGLGKRTTAEAMAEVLFEGEDAYKRVAALAPAEAEIIKTLAGHQSVALFRYVAEVSNDAERINLTALLKRFKENAPTLDKAGQPAKLNGSIFVATVNADLPFDLLSSENKEADESMRLWLQRNFKEFSADFFQSFDAIIPFKRFNVAAKTRLAEMLTAKVVKEQAAEGRTLSVDNSVTAYVGSRTKDDLGALDVQRALDHYVMEPFHQVLQQYESGGGKLTYTRIHVVEDIIRISPG